MRHSQDIAEEEPQLVHAAFNTKITCISAWGYGVASICVPSLHRDVGPRGQLGIRHAVTVALCKYPCYWWLIQESVLEYNHYC